MMISSTFPERLNRQNPMRGAMGFSAIGLAAIGFAALTLAFGVGCQTLPVPIKIEPARSALSLPSRQCKLLVEDPVDARPTLEKEGNPSEHVIFLLPLVPIWWQQDVEAIRYQLPATAPSQSVTRGIKDAIRRIIEESGTCTLTEDPSVADLVLSTQIEHLFAANYERRAILYSILAVISGAVTAFPTAQVAVTCALRRGTTQETISTWSLDEKVIFDPALQGSQIGDVAAFRGPGRETNRARVIEEALRRLFGTFGPVLDREIVSAGFNEVFGAPSDTFIILRQLEDYHLAEHAIVDATTGRVELSAITPRLFPVVGRPNEWVVSPYQPHYMDVVAYRDLVQKLSDRFDVRFDGNVTAARFYGLRAHSESTPRAESTPRPRGRRVIR
ncbi:MAG: hypothetical protein IPK13_03685 [Deltaproteobacteria bacterium]|nr:hypothetical protein [Deltaproteobacteria bacterium]